LNISEMQKKVHTLAIEKGWYDFVITADDVDIPERLANIHAEVSEAFEDYRDGVMETWYKENGKPCGFPSEMADIVIRVMDLCEAIGIDLEHEIEVKHAYNKTRAYRHGGKRC
jgi:NTP pyrophosphatase (non-canonical NTP hydrolase)